MKAKDYAVLSRAIELGISYGLRRVFKYRDSDLIDSETLASEPNVGAIHDAIMAEVCEWFQFEEVE